MDIDSAGEDIDGSIQSVHVKNFFCHDNLEVNFNRNINFIVGRNGSGKSAILTALVVGLGGRASATNRGNSLSAFVKKGCNSASVEIKIKNSSPKAYKPEIYGNSIIIVRNITVSGGSSYKVKSASGEIKSTKLEEVHAITLAHDIQVDNPISVLNQDDARSFHASDAKKKYMLFRRSTNLDQTERNYLLALENCKRAQSLWKRKTEACADLEKEYKKWKTHHEQLQSRDEIEIKQKKLQNEYYWSEIAELERDMKSDQALYDKHNTRVQTLMDRLSKMTENHGSNTDVLDKLKAELEEKRLEKTAVEQELGGLENEVRQAQSSLRSAQSSSHKHRELHQRETRKINDLQREIQSIDSNSAASSRARLEEAARKANEQLTAAEQRYNTGKVEAEQARGHVAHCERRRDDAKATLQAALSKQEQLKQQLRELQSRGNDSLAVFGANVVELVKKVKQATDRGVFSAPPRGPIGSYIKVKEKKWGGALEHLLGGAIQSFCVNNVEDSKKLFKIMDEVYGSASKPSVTVSQFRAARHAVSGHQTRAAPHHCALEHVQLQDVVIYNYLLDSHSWETVLLVPDHDDAIRLSNKRENVPKNCSKIVTLDCTEYYPQPNYRCYGGSDRKARFLTLSTADRIDQLKAEIQENNEVIRVAQAELNEIKQEVASAQEIERSAGRALQALMNERHLKSSAARAAGAALDQHHAPHRDVLMEELNIAQEKAQSLKAQLEELTDKENQFKQKIDEYDNIMKHTKKKLNEVSTVCRNLSEEIEQEQLKLDQGITQRRSYQQKLKEDKQKLSQVEQVIKEKSDNIQQKKEAALLLCPPIENPRDMAIVRNELKKSQLKLSSYLVSGLSKAEVAEKLLGVEQHYSRTSKTLGRLKELIDEIQNTTNKHLKFCYEVQTFIARRVQYCFQSILNVNKYNGSMSIDHSKATLEIVCTGRETSEKRHAVSTASLSGGERSYSTVAFIMALWDCVEVPFYFMDEFDVFMDNVNRKIVMDLLIDHALKNTHNQFVFLTPQDASSVKRGPSISIHKMADPKR